jgi:hypothetical protein
MPEMLFRMFLHTVAGPEGVHRAMLSCGGESHRKVCSTRRCPPCPFSASNTHDVPRGKYWPGYSPLLMQMFLLPALFVPSTSTVDPREGPLVDSEHPVVSVRRTRESDLILRVPASKPMKLPPEDRQIRSRTRGSYLVRCTNVFTSDGRSDHHSSRRVTVMYSNSSAAPSFHPSVCLHGDSSRENTVGVIHQVRASWPLHG